MTPAVVIRGDAAHIPMPDASVDLIVTSPPFFALRSYTDGGVHYPGQIGSEATPQDYIEALVECAAEWMRVLKPSGSMFVDLGDKYDSGTTSPRTNPGTVKDGQGQGWHLGSPRTTTGRPKSLMLLPERYRIAAVDQLGLICRAVIVWCLSGGARVYARTPTGDRPIMIRDLARSYHPDNIQLWNGERWTQVRGWNRTPDDDGALEIELRTGERIGCTPGHQWPTTRGLLRADQVRVGDIITTTTLPAPAEPRTPALLPDDDIGWLVGLYIAEGSRSGTTIQIAGHTKETARHARLTRIAAALDGTAHVYRTSRNGATCNLTGPVLVGVIDRYVSAGTARTKRLRHAAWQRSNAFLAALVDGYLSGDGHYDAKNDRWRLGFTENDEWAADLRTLAARLGAVVRLRRAAHTMAGRMFPGWVGEWRWNRSTHHNAKADGEVVAIRRSRARDFYDIGVADEPHLFALASGVLTHNSKPNGLPESVTDRVRRSHEDWVHLTKQPRYYSAVDEIREPHAEPEGRAAYGRTRPPAPGGNRGLHVGRGTHAEQRDMGQSPLGKLPGSVWSIPSEPLQVPPHLGIDHFAAFPSEWCRRLILGWSPPGICTACGEGRRPAVDAMAVNIRQQDDGAKAGRALAIEKMQRPLLGARNGVRFEYDRTITGYVCACTPYTDHPGTGERHRNGDHPSGGNAGGNVNAGTRLGDLGSAVRVGPWREHHLDGWTPPPTRPAIVLDPFGGTGTTALVASVLGRIGISVDRSADYSRLAAWRTTDPGERARALRVPKPEPVAEAQLALDWEVA